MVQTNQLKIIFIKPLFVINSPNLLGISSVFIRTINDNNYFNCAANGALTTVTTALTHCSIALTIQRYTCICNYRLIIVLCMPTLYFSSTCGSHDLPSSSAYGLARCGNQLEVYIKIVSRYVIKKIYRRIKIYNIYTVKL